MPEDYKELTKQTEKLIRAYNRKPVPEEDKKAPKIQVDKIVSKLAFLYEKVRNVIDYKEEHLLRKNAIKRILKRRLTWKAKAGTIAGPLIYELIRGGYLENGKVPEYKIKKTSHIIGKYILLLNSIHSGEEREEISNNKLIDWVLGVAACEIEDLFVPRYKDEAMAEYMYQVMNNSIAWSSKKLTKEEKSIQIYIAIQRALLKSDRDIITYHIFNLYYPDWHKAEDKLIKEISSDIYSVYKGIEEQIDHPLSNRLIGIVKKYIPPFMILHDLLEKKGEEAEDLLMDQENLELEIKEACDKRYADTKTKLRRSSVRSIIYIFISKMLLALALEVPYDFYIAEKIDYFPLAVNVIFHPLLLFFIALSIKVPAEKNTEKILDIIKRVIYTGEEELVVEKVRSAVNRNIVMNILFNLIYVVVFVASFGILIFILRNLLGFNILGIGIFLLFLSLVSFFGIRNRESVRELIVVGEREGIITTTIDFFAIPILRAGRWLSLNFSRINVLVFVFDFIIEAPFKAFIEIIEDFSSFIKEKKEEITMK